MSKFRGMFGDFGNLILDFYAAKDLVWPDDFWKAMAFAHTEIAEAFEVFLARDDWNRNNPENKPTYTSNDLEKELSQAIMMIQVAGMCMDVDPLLRLKEDKEVYLAGYEGRS